MSAFAKIWKSCDFHASNEEVLDRLCENCAYIDVKGCPFGGWRLGHQEDNYKVWQCQLWWCGIKGETNGQRS